MNWPRSVVLLFLLAAATAQEDDPKCQNLKLTDADKKNSFDAASGTKVIYEASTQMQWSDSRTWCTNKGLKQVSLKSLQETENFSSELKRLGYRGYNFWLSASDIGQTPGRFQWVDGTTLNRSIWEGGQPDDFGAGKETCIYLSAQYTKLRDFSCSANSFYTLCEVPAPLKSCV